ncbi:MAG: ferritin [Fusobacteriaceae bacterium]|jgi:bacterioferritin|nr:ferritin [Fusobacteriaceae bacterium]
MGLSGRKLLMSIDADEVIELLNKALADEWLAYYQYWIGAKVVKGPMKESVIAELLQHATDELRHADMVANRINQLGGTPLLSPEDWIKKSNCKYEAPIDPYVLEVLKQNIDGERCAIGVYKKLMDITKDKDVVTYEMALQILQDEVEHEEDLQALEEDFDLMFNRKS